MQLCSIENSAAVRFKDRPLIVAGIINPSASRPREMIYEAVYADGGCLVFFAANLRGFNSILSPCRRGKTNLRHVSRGLKPRVRRTGGARGTRVDADIFVIHRALPPSARVWTGTLIPPSPSHPRNWHRNDVPRSYRSRIYNRPDPSVRQASAAESATRYCRK